MRRVHLGHAVDHVVGHVRRDGTFGHAFELHADLDAFREHRTLLEEHQLGVVVAERLLGFEVQRAFEAGRLVQQRGLDLLEQIDTAKKEFDRLREFVDQLALGVFESPGERDDARGLDLHREMIAHGVGPAS